LVDLIYLPYVAIICIPVRLGLGMGLLLQTPRVREA
jgi:hypothetical protein